MAEDISLDIKDLQELVAHVLKNVEVIPKYNLCWMVFTQKRILIPDILCIEIHIDIFYILYTIEIRKHISHNSGICHRALNRMPQWWRHQMETFSALLALCAMNSPVTGEFPAQRPVTRSFDVFFDLRLK